jgi:hypothetical protein
MNYSSALFETIKGYVARTTSPVDPVCGSGWGTGTSIFTSKEQIDTFIQQAEQRIFNSVQFPNFRKNQTGVLSPSNQYLEAPPYFLASYSLAVITNDSYEYLLNKDVNYIRAAYPNPTVEGIPKYYAQFDDNTFILGPTPDVAYTVEMHYFFYPESIVTAGTTWLGDNFDSALLYGALVEAYTYMKGEADIVAAYNKRYEEAMILAKRLGDGMNRRDAYRSGQVRMTVN